MASNATQYLSPGTSFGPNILQLAIQDALQSVPTPDGSNPLAAANVQYVLDNGGGGSDQSLNEINAANPLNGPLSINNNAVIVRDPQSLSECANAQYVQNQVQIEANARIAQDNTLQTNIDNEESARQAADQGLQDNID
jgi:hypothetical protein